MKYGFEALVQFSVLVPAGLGLFLYLPEAVVPGAIQNLLPYSLLSVAWLVIIVLIAGGWPLVPPLGPSRWRLKQPFAGLGLTFLWLALSTATALALRASLTNSQITVLGIVFLWTAFAWGVNFGSWPLRYYRPSTALAVGSVVSFTIAMALTYVLRGIDTGYLMGLMTYHVAWSLVISPSFILQGYQIRRFHRQPRIGIASAGVAALLAVVSWEIVTVRFGLVSSEVSQVIAAGVAMWSLLYSWGFGFAGLGNYRQPRRGILALVIVLILSAAWATIALRLWSEAIALYATLVVLPSLLIVHNTFFLRSPLPPPLLPGMPPQYQRGVEVVRKWYLQLVD